MSLSAAFKAGAIGAAAIFIGRKITMGSTTASGKHPLYMSAGSNGKSVLPAALKPASLDKNGYSAMFWIIPAAGAYYLSK